MEGHDILFIGTQHSVQAYDVYNNMDLFHRDMPNGVFSLSLGSDLATGSTVLFVGSNGCVFGLDAAGEEMCWLMSNDVVSAVCEADVNNDGSLKLLAGGASCEIQAFQHVCMPYSKLTWRISTILRLRQAVCSAWVSALWHAIWLLSSVLHHLLMRHHSHATQHRNLLHNLLQARLFLAAGKAGAPMA